MEDSKNVFLAIVLSIIFLVGWKMLYVNPVMEEQYAQIAKEEKEKISVASNDEKSETATPKEKVTKPRNDIISADINQNSRIRISSKGIDGSISLKGAKFDDLTLKRYRQQLDDKSPPVVLLSPKNSMDSYFAEFGWLSAKKSIKVPDSNTVWKADKNIFSANETVNLSWDNGAGLIFKRAISLDDDYMFTITDSVENTSLEDIKLLPFGLVNKIEDISDTSFYNHEGFIGSINDVLQEVHYSDMNDDPLTEFNDAKGWIALTDKYWLTALIPDSSLTFSVKSKHYTSKANTQKVQVDYLGEASTVSAGSSLTLTNHFFAGAKKAELLDTYEENLDISLLSRSIDFGMLYFISRPLFSLMTYFYGLVENFGVAILLLTMVVRIVMFPLSNKSFKSMAKMKLYMPELTAIKERYKGDRTKMNNEMMSFYKKNNINPMSGCLPMLIQLPIFFALYRLLLVTIDMRHAEFAGWIVDLSAPDPTNIFNLFGLINWTPPAFLPVIGVLPVLFALSMYIQQMLNPTPTDKTQAMVMKFLPFIFLILFASFPAGLVLYWFWSNILGIIQQWIITKKLNPENVKAEAEAAIAAKAAKAKSKTKVRNKK